MIPKGQKYSPDVLIDGILAGGCVAVCFPNLDLLRAWTRIIGPFIECGKGGGRYEERKMLWAFSNGAIIQTLVIYKDGGMHQLRGVNWYDIIVPNFINNREFWRTKDSFIVRK